MTEVRALAQVTALAGDGDGFCVVDHGRRFCGGLRRPFRRVGNEADIASVTGPRSGCVMTATGQVRCGPFGANAQTMTLPGPAIAIAAAERHGCAVLRGGSVTCWEAALDTPAGPVGSAPAQVKGINAATTIAASASAFCVLAHDRVQCFGEDYYGVLGDGTYSEAGRDRVGDPIEKVGDATYVGGGEGSHFCSLDREGRVYCWGPNLHGELGTGVGEMATGPVPIDISREPSASR